jgi:hypothetical protein
VYGVPLNHESKTDDFLFIVCQSISRNNTAKTININALPLHSIHVATNQHLDSLNYVGTSVTMEHEASQCGASENSLICFCTDFCNRQDDTSPFDPTLSQFIPGHFLLLTRRPLQGYLGMTFLNQNFI